MKIKSPYLVKPGAKLRLDDYPTDDMGSFKKEKDALVELEKHRNKLGELQEVLFAEGKHALLIVLQAMDTGGKDGTIRHIFSGVNPQGVTVTPFKVPTPLEAAHDYLWRAHAAVPRLGTIGIFNRSHYEDVLVTRVHKMISDEEAHKRMEAINNFEWLLTELGSTHIIKVYLHTSKAERHQRLEDRLSVPSKMWKYSNSDFAEAKLWPEYEKMYEDCFARCNKTPWLIVPSDQNWYKEYLVAKALRDLLKGLKMKYPGITKHS